MSAMTKYLQTAQRSESSRFTSFVLLTPYHGLLRHSYFCKNFIFQVLHHLFPGLCFAFFPLLYPKFLKGLQKLQFLYFNIAWETPRRSNYLTFRSHDDAINKPDFNNLSSQLLSNQVERAYNCHIKLLCCSQFYRRSDSMHKRTKK